MVVIVESGDLIITVIEYDDTVKIVDGQEPVIRQTVDFQVRRSVLATKSSVFRKLLSSPNFKEAAQETVLLKDDRVASMNIWFRILHAVDVDTTGTTALEEMWHLAATCDKYDLSIRDLQRWFAKWYGMQKVDTLDPRELLYPCWLFDHAEGFGAASKSLAYDRTGHLTEHNPTKHLELHLPSRVIQQLNAAKGRLRTVLHNGLFKPNEQLLMASCPCRKETLYDYEKRLWQVEVWPLERVAQRTAITILLDRLDHFEEPPKQGCSRNCRRDFKSIVASVKNSTRDYFDGLCVDCMDKSKPKTGDLDMDYWRHDDLREEEWAFGCRFDHKQPTWYFSFMGRQEDRDRFRKEKRDKRERLHEFWGEI